MTTVTTPPPPFWPHDLVLAADPAGATAREAQAAIEAALGVVDRAAAHQLAAAARDDPAAWHAAASFYLRPESGRRGARRLLRWCRLASAGDPASPLCPDAAEPLAAWAHFRLRRHGRALAAARRAASALHTAPSPAPLAAARWAQALEAIRLLALRQGHLGLARRAHELQDARLASAAGALGSAGWERARTHMEAVVFLLDHRPEHGLPSSLVRYLARSLGHPHGHSRVAWLALAIDLSLEPQHLDEAHAIATRYGFGERVETWLAELGERRFQGHWRRRRRVRLAVTLLGMLLAVGAILFLLVVIANLR